MHLQNGLHLLNFTHKNYITIGKTRVSHHKLYILEYFDTHNVVRLWNFSIMLSLLFVVVIRYFE